jgi:hypothetical protein
MPTFKNRLDAVITGRGCDPHYHAADGTCVYELQDDGMGDDPFIAAWTPPDVSYGDEPTTAEINAVSDADAESANDVYLTSIAAAMLADRRVAQAIVEVLSSVAGEDVEPQVLEALKAKL